MEYGVNTVMDTSGDCSQLYYTKSNMYGLQFYTVVPRRRSIRWVSLK